MWLNIKLCNFTIRLEYVAPIELNNEYMILIWDLFSNISLKRSQASSTVDYSDLTVHTLTGLSSKFAHKKAVGSEKGMFL